MRRLSTSGLLMLFAVSACGESTPARPDPVPTPPQPPALALAQFSIEPQSVLSGEITHGTLTLSGPAPPGGAVVTVTSSHTGVAAGSGRFAAGETTATTVISTGGFTEVPVDVTLTASLGMSSRAALLHIRPFLPRILRFYVQSRVLGGQPGEAWVELDRPAPAAGASVAITVDDSVVPPLGSVLILPGATRVDFRFATSRPSQDVRVTFTARYGESFENTTIRVVRGSP